MSLQPGTRFGPYEIIAPIGAGGMGEVYRAQDTKLGRDVAIKVLPAAVATDPDRLARFHREAQVLASLNHPNIAAIYGFEDSNVTHALVMELVEGPTLADRIAQGPIPVNETLPIARQIAEALEAAHEKGIVHRDLKPANIKMTADGKVKVLDFGLAKMVATDVAASGGGLSMSPTLSVHATYAGVILGTAAYMSPEQARGHAIDARTDLWAFGCVVYEMLTRRQVFPAGETVSDTIAAILKNDVSWSALPRETPVPVRRLLRRCLEKDRSRRINSAAVARLELDDAAGAPDEVPRDVHGIAAVRQRDWKAWITAGVGAVIALLAIAYGAFHRTSSGNVQTTRFAINPPDGWRLDLTLGPSGGSPRPLAISPDGRRIAFIARRSSVEGGDTGSSMIWMRSLDTVDARPLPGTEGGVMPFWSPDSRFLGFFAGGKLKKVDLTGAPAVTLSDAPDPRGGTWNRDGVIVFSPSNQGPLQQVSSSGGPVTAATALAEGETSHRTPAFLPDGQHLLFYTTPAGTVSVGALGGQRPKVLLPTTSSQNVAYSAGYLLFLRENTLLAQPFDLTQLQVSGTERPIADQVLTNGTPSIGVFAVSDTGVLVYETGRASDPSSVLTWFDRAGKSVGIVDKAGPNAGVSLSPDGQRLAINRTDLESLTAGQPRNVDIWIDEFARQTTTRLTFDSKLDQEPVWSPDGTRIAWSSNRRRGRFDLFAKLASGAGNEDTLLVSDVSKYAYDWSLDGRYLIYGTPTDGKIHLWVLPMTGEDRQPHVYLQIGFNTSQARFSPDGRYVAYTSDATGRNEVYVQPFPDATAGKWSVSHGGGDEPRWRHDGKELYYISSDLRLVAVPVTTTPAFRLGLPQELFNAPVLRSPTAGAGGAIPTRYDVAPDGQKFLINAMSAGETTAPLAPLTVALDWPADIGK